jgi:nicotinate-nucleotide adenylyltransferase
VPDSSLLPPPSSPALGLLGGTFDPPHIAHLLLAECARHQLGLQRVLFLPAGDPWRKTGTTNEQRATGPRAGGPDSSLLPPPSSPRRVTPAIHRLAMVRLAIEGNPHFALDDRETRRPGPSYTVDTLEELHARGHTNLVLILGSDALADMPSWKSPERIRALARLAVAEAGREEGGGRRGSDSPIDNRQSSIVNVEMPPLPIRSTLIRERAAAGLPIRYLVPEPVFAYIEAHGLYRGQG